MIFDMKTPKVEKLPSGNFRVRLQIDGQRYSCTSKTKKEAQDAAKKLYAGIQFEKRLSITVGKAIDNYIDEKKATLSPSTIKGYESIRKNYLQSIMSINLSDLTQSDVQIAVGKDVEAGKSPKTIRNAHGLLAAVVDEYRPTLILRTTLPQKEKIEMRILSEEEMIKVMAQAKDSEYELPILLAAWLGLRMSEIRGLKFSDISDGRIHVHRAIVAGPDGDVEKGTKTTSGDRWIKLPDTILGLISMNFTDRYGAIIDQSGKIVDEKLDNYIIEKADITIYKNFIKICKEAGVEPCRFHDLRHFAASEAHALGVPDKYAMKRMGHKTDNMLKNVYLHTMKDKEDEFADLIDSRMEDIYNGTLKPEKQG